MVFFKEEVRTWQRICLVLLPIFSQEIVLVIRCHIAVHLSPFIVYVNPSMVWFIKYIYKHKKTKYSTELFLLCRFPPMECNIHDGQKILFIHGVRCFQVSFLSTYLFLLAAVQSPDPPRVGVNTCHVIFLTIHFHGAIHEDQQHTSLSRLLMISVDRWDSPCFAIYTLMVPLVFF